MILEVGAPHHSEAIADPAALEGCLDHIEQQLDRPTLIQLTGSSGTLHIGLGHPAVSVALYLDANGKPWAGRQPTPPTGTDPLTFAKGDTTYDFYPSAAITATAARQAAREFAATSERPTSLTWMPEGG